MEFHRDPLGFLLWDFYCYIWRITSSSVLPLGADVICYADDTMARGG